MVEVRLVDAGIDQGVTLPGFQRFSLPQREADLLRHYTLSDEDLQVVPGPVAGAYVFVFMVLLFRQGVRLVAPAGTSWPSTGCSSPARCWSEAATRPRRGTVGRRRPPDRTRRRPRRRQPGGLPRQAGRGPRDRQGTSARASSATWRRWWKHEQFYDLDVLTVTVDTRALV